MILVGCGEVEVARYATPVFGTFEKPSFEEIYRYEFATGNPLSFHVLDQDLLAVVDYGSPERIVSTLALPEGAPRGSLREGEGPNELSRGGLKYIHPLDGDRLWVWDAGARRGIVLNGMDEAASVHMPSALLMVPLNDTLAVSYGSSRSRLASFHRVDLKEGRLDETPLYGVEYADHPDLEPLQQNYLLKQGRFASDDEAVYIGLSFGSHMFRLDASGLGFQTAEPANLPIPDLRRDAGTIAAPDNADYPQTTLALSVDGDRLYVLFSGVQLLMSQTQAMWEAARGRLDAILEEAETSDRLLVYDKRTGDFLHELRLPVKARDVEIRGENMYILTVDGMPPTIIKYRTGPAT